MIGARPRLFNQGKMPPMQRAHGGHKRDSLPGARRAASAQGGDGFAQQRKFTDDLHVDKVSDKGGHSLYHAALDRKSVVAGQVVAVRVESGGVPGLNKQKNK